MNRTVIAWSAAALLGLAATAGVTWAASRLAGQRIALSDQPTTIVTQLAPAAGPHVRRRTRPAVTVTTAAPTTTVTAPATTALPTTTVTAPATTLPTTTVTAPPTQTVTTAAPTQTVTAPATATAHATSASGGHEDGGGHQQRDD